MPALERDYVDTDTLIKALAEDLKVRWSLGRAFGFATVGGALAAGILFFLSLGFRPDVTHAMQTIRFPFKLVDEI